LLRYWHKALPTEQLDQPPGADIDLDAIRLKIDPALLHAAATQGGLKLASLNWIIASLANHGFVTINGENRRLRAVATTAGYLAVARRPALPDDTQSLH
jgi:hypothetical protein